MNGLGRNEWQRADDSTAMSSAPAAIAEAAADGGNERAQVRRMVGFLLAAYWSALFLAMHVRLDSPPTGLPGADKIVHFVGYGILGSLLTLWVALGRRITGPAVAILLTILALYGVLDELLQIPVGRTCDVYDWGCDLSGAAFGILLMFSIVRHRLL